MAKYRMVRTDFWKNPIVLEEMTPEDKYFYLYLLTNSNTTQIGIYKITKKQMAFDLGYSLEGVQALMERFIQHHQVIRYNPATRELAIKNWGKENLHKTGKPVLDCISIELKEVEDHSMIQYVLEFIQNQEIRRLYESYCGREQMVIEKLEDDRYLEPECDEIEEGLPIDGKKDEQLHQSSHPSKEDKENPFLQNQEDVKGIIEFWDTNGFGLTNVNAKEQLLSWLNDSNFLQPKEMILKALKIACANNKRRLSYVVGVLKNWENESLLTVEEIDSYQEKQTRAVKNRQRIDSSHGGRPVPDLFVPGLKDDDE
ncbi:DnaD domain protein [Neobacillus niacini]|uniref:DnaD domain-containing protein n=1 Tax=Neobacillus niacini TaxID=86668 RepID=UPI003001AF4D